MLNYIKIGRIEGSLRSFENSWVKWEDSPVSAAYGFGSANFDLFWLKFKWSYSSG